MAAKEAQARIKINKLLEEGGWRFFDDAHGKANIQLEANVKLDALGDNFETTNGFVDFLLLDERGHPVVVLEAKSEDKNPLAGKEQARKYARGHAFVQPYYLSPQDVAACLQHPARPASDNHVAGRLHAALRTCLPDTEHLLSPV